jgi:proline iminopeptidase
MKDKGRSIKKYVLLILSWILLFIGIVLGIIGAVLGFLFSAALMSNVFLLSLIGILVCFLISFFLSWFAGKRILPSLRTRFALGAGVATILVVILLSAVTIFKPLIPSSERIQSFVPPDVRFWQLDSGSRIAYQRFPAVEKRYREPVIFLHGGPGGAVVSFQPITDVISSLSGDGYDVYLYDQIGGGLSGRLRNIKGYTLSRQIADLENIRQKIGTEKMILIGESFGGMLAAHYVAHYPENIEKIVLISPGGLVFQEWTSDNEERGGIRSRASEGTLEEFRDLLINPRTLFVGALIEINPDAAYNFLSEPEADAFTTKLFSLLLGGMACDPEKFPKDHSILFGFWSTMKLEEFSEIDAEKVKSYLRDINIPFLILKPECDYVQWDATYEYKKILKNAKLLYLEGAGHMPFLEKPDLVLSSIRAFLFDDPLPLPEYNESSPPKK